MISTIEISLIAVLAIINYQGVAAVTREREVGEIVPMRAEHSATQNDDVNRGAPNAIDLDFDTSSYTKQKDGSAWFKLTLDKVSCIKKVIRYRRDGLADLSWTCTQSADGRCKQCKAVSSNSCGMYTLSISTTEDAASSGASLPSNSDCKYGDTIELTTSSSTFILYELAVIAKEVVQCTLPAVSENSQYEVEGVAQGDGTNVAVGTSFTLVCDEGYTFKNSKTSVQTCTEDLATSDISNECTLVQCTLPAVSENSQYEVEGVAQGDGTNVAVGTSFTLVCDEGYTFKNSKTSVQTCTEDLATSDISNECTLVQCTLPAVSENSQYEVEGVAQGDGTNVAVGTSFTLVCDEGYTFKNSKTSVQTCTEDLATSDISNECTRQEEHEKYSAGTKAWSGHVFVVISTLLSFYIA
ncbi:hypothetical protein ACHWQZ_G007544 [Mnemiopsis leidyi]